MVGGEVGKVRPIWWRAIGSAVIPIGVFLAACSHDPVQPAPVQLMGAGSAGCSRTDDGGPATGGQLSRYPPHRGGACTDAQRSTA